MTAKKPRKKYLKVVEIYRSGRVFWRTETKIPANMQSNLGFKKNEDGSFEVERPRATELAAFGKAIQDFGYTVSRLEEKAPVKTSKIEGDTLTEGEACLNKYFDKKNAMDLAKTAYEGARGELQEWLVDHGAPKDPAHEEARVAKIGRHTAHNSWISGRETKWDERDHKPVCDWAIEEGCAEELVTVILHKTVSYEEFKANGVPEGFAGTFNVDRDVYDMYVRIGALPKEVHDSFEARGKGYYSPKVFETKEYECPSCGTSVKKAQKFCGECGTKLSF